MTHYAIQLYKLYYKNTNNLLPSCFNSFTPYYNNAEPTHGLRSATLRLPMTKREYFVQSTKYQFLKRIRETSIIVSIELSILQYFNLQPTLSML